MGYRSDVMAVFYTYEPNEYPAMKLFIDEHIPDVFRTEDYMRTFESNSGSNLRGIKFKMDGWKWYESYPEINGFEKAIETFEAISVSGTKWYWEFVRLGEEVEDVDERHGYNSENLLYVVRSIECDF